MLTKSLSVRFTVPRCRPPQPVAGADCPDPQAQEACAVRPCIHYTSLLNESLTQARSLRSPNSYFMDVKVRPDLRRRPATRQRTDPPLSLTQCPGCFNITTVFSHAQTVVLCGSCSTVLCQPTGGRCRLTEGAPFPHISGF